MLSAAPRFLVFDLDGTLIDSSLDLCNSVNAALAHVGKPSLPNALIASYIGDGAAMLVRRALGDPGDLDALHPSDGDDLFRRTFEFFLTYYRAHKLDNTYCYDGVLDALTHIRARHPHLPMAVLTNKPVNPSRDICRALGLENSDQPEANAVARKVIEFAQRGERDPVRLREYVLQALQR